MSAGAPGVVEAYRRDGKTGLYVSTAAVTEKTLPQADMDRMRRIMATAERHGLKAFFFCGTCRKPVEAIQEDRIVRTVRTEEGQRKAPGGRLRLTCGCTMWRVR